MNNLQNEPLAELNTDDEVEKYSYAAAARELGHEPFPVVAADAGGLRLPQTDADEYFASLAEATRQFGDVAAETGKSIVSGVRQVGQEAINTGIDWFGMQLKEFYKVNGFASDEQVDAILPESMLQHLNDKGINTELPLKHIAPNTELGITARELTAYATGFLMTMGRGQAKQAGESVIDYLGRHSHNLLRAVRGNTGGAMALNVEEANLSDLAVELGFDEELRAYFAEGSVADTAAEGVADELAIRANPKLEEGTQLTAEGRLARKLDTVLEDNALGAMFGAAILTAAKGFKLAKAAPKTTALGTGAVVAGTSSDAESSPASKIGANIVEGATDAAGAAAKQFDTDYLGFYSKALDIARGLPQNKATGDQYLRMLSKAGVTDDELYWTGLQDYASEIGKMDKQQLVNFLKRNRVELEQIELRSVEETPDYIDFIEEAVDGADEIEYQKEFIYETAADRVGEFQDYLERFMYLKDDEINRIVGNFKEALVDGDAVDTEYLDFETEKLFDEFAYYSAKETYDENPVIRYTPDREPEQTQVEYEIVGQDGLYTVLSSDGKAIDSFSKFGDAKGRVEQLASDDGSLNTEPAQYEKWTQPGGSDYREHIIRFDDYRGDPGVTDAYADFSPESQDEWRRLQDLNEEAVARGTRLEEADQRKFDELKARVEMMRERNETARTFDADHFAEQEDNIVAHYRTKERRTSDGKRILYVEEIQSDWAGEGRKRGFMQSTAADDQARINEIVEGNAQYRNAKNKLNELENLFALDKLGQLPEDRANYATEFFPELKGETFASKDEKLNKIREKTNELSNKMMEYREMAVRRQGIPSSPFSESGKTRVPRAPFVYNTQTGKENTGAWTRLVLKRVLMQAAEEGYDGIAIASGRASADHYNLRKYFEWVDIIRDATPHPVDGKPTYSLVAKPKGSGGSYTQDLHSIHQDELPGIIGQEQATKAIKALEAKQQRTDVLAPDYNQDDNAPLRLAGSDLASGGEGMLNFYDKIVPASMSKVLSKIDKSVKPQQVGVRKSGDKTGGQRSDLDLGLIFTDELKEKLKKGLPLFMPPALVVGAEAMSDKANQQANTAQMEMQF